MSIVKSIEITNKKLNDGLIQYGKTKGKPYIFTLIFSLLLVISIILVIIFLINKLYGFATAFILFAAFMLVIILSAYTKEADKNKRIYARYIESKLISTAKENNRLPISPIIPLFLSVNDDNKELIIHYNDEVIIQANYNEIKKYNIYYNKENKLQGKLPSKPLKLIKSYRLEIDIDNNLATIDFYNIYSKYRFNNKIDFMQLVNTKSINDISAILDKIIWQNKKNKKN